MLLTDAFFQEERRLSGNAGYLERQQSEISKKNAFFKKTRSCGQLTEKRASDGIFVHVKALFNSTQLVFDAAHRAQNGTQMGVKRTHMHFVS